MLYVLSILCTNYAQYFGEIINTKFNLNVTKKNQRRAQNKGMGCNGSFAFPIKSKNAFHLNEWIYNFFEQLHMSVFLHDLKYEPSSKIPNHALEANNS